MGCSSQEMTVEQSAGFGSLVAPRIGLGETNRAGVNPTAFGRSEPVEAADLPHCSGVSVEPLRVQELRDGERHMLVLDVVGDEHGERHKPWRDARRDISRHEFSDWSRLFERPPAVWDMYMSKEQKGRDLERLRLFLREAGMTKHDGVPRRSISCVGPRGWEESTICSTHPL